MIPYTIIYDILVPLNHDQRVLGWKSHLYIVPLTVFITYAIEWSILRLKTHPDWINPVSDIYIWSLICRIINKNNSIRPSKVILGHRSESFLS